MTNPLGRKIAGSKLAWSVEPPIRPPVFPFFLCQLGV
jgi:hypothetical protein